MACFANIHDKMAGKSPYSPEFIQKCVELYQAGTPVELLSKNSGVPMRTLYRWIKTHAVGGKPVDPDNLSLDANYQKLVSTKPMTHSAALGWIDNLEITLNKLGELHSSLLEDLHRLLEAAINTSDPSPRAINTLSMCLTRHADSLLKVALQGREKQVEVNQALSTLESYGYSVLDSGTLKELFGESNLSVQPDGGDAPPTHTNRAA